MGRVVTFLFAGLFALAAVPKDFEPPPTTIFFIAVGCNDTKISITYSSAVWASSETEAYGEWTESVDFDPRATFYISAQNGGRENCGVSVDIVAATLAAGDAAKEPFATKDRISWIFAHGHIMKTASATGPFGVASAAWSAGGSASTGELNPPPAPASSRGTAHRLPGRTR